MSSGFVSGLQHFLELSVNKNYFYVAAGAIALGLSSISPAPAADTSPATQDEELETVLITGQRSARVSRGATGLNLQDAGANSLNDALRLATGINVEEWETNRSNYMARGFDILNTQVDGIGMPNDWGIVTGAMDAFGFEKLEVIRGANGLLTGVGNSSGTINYVRKRPTNEPQALLNASVGSWNSRRIEADYSTPFTQSGSWAGRVVAAYDDSDSYLRLLQNDRMYVYGVVDGQIGERTVLTLGYSFQDTNTDGNMWGGLPLANSDGTQAEFDRDATTAQDWALWDTRNQNAFLEVTHALPAGWTLKGTYNFRKSVSDSKLFYSYAETGLDPQTHEGVVGYPGSYGDSSHAHLGDISVSGRVSAFGREHDLTLGIAQAYGTVRSHTRDAVNDVDAGDPDPYPVMPAFPYDGDAAPEPIWGPRYDYANGGQWLRRVYGAARVSLAPRVKAVVGFNQTRFHRQGLDTFGGAYNQTLSKLSPYAGVTVDVTSHVLAYASYSDIYQPQDQSDINHHYLDPTRGVNMELGVKADWLKDRLLTSLAWFSAKQKGLATQAAAPVVEGDDFYWYFEGVDVDSKGFEFEATGKLNDYTNLVLGVTSLKLKGADGENIYRWAPRRTVNISLSTRLPVLPKLRLGLNGRWQSHIANMDDASVLLIRQDGYALLNLFGEWRANDHLSVRANLDNLTGKKYIGSLYWVGYYGAPRNYSIGVDYKF
jgi:outer membrane receptor for ferric coprogen and ferric-rhodotorulic acid